MNDTRQKADAALNAAKDDMKDMQSRLERVGEELKLAHRNLVMLLFSRTVKTAIKTTTISITTITFTCVVFIVDTFFEHSLDVYRMISNLLSLCISYNFLRPIELIWLHLTMHTQGVLRKEKDDLTAVVEKLQEMVNAPAKVDTDALEKMRILLRETSEEKDAAQEEVWSS